MLEIIQVSPSTIEAAQGIVIDMPCLAYVGMANGEVVGSGGLAWGKGRCWVWLRIETGNPSYALPIFHRTKALLAKARQFGETQVFTPRDANYPTSKKLLTVLGFRLHEIDQNGIEVWRFAFPQTEMVG